MLAKNWEAQKQKKAKFAPKKVKRVKAKTKQLIKSLKA